MMTVGQKPSEARGGLWDRGGRRDAGDVEALGSRVRDQPRLGLVKITQKSRSA